MSRTIELTLVHTNDLHCNLERWPYTAAVVRAELARAEAAGRHAIYVDAGDFTEMSHPVCYGTRGELTIRLLSALGCSAMSPGNNEIMRTHRDTMTALAGRSPFPWVCANLRDLEGCAKGSRSLSLHRFSPGSVVVVRGPDAAHGRLTTGAAGTSPT